MFQFFGCKACRVLGLRPGTEPAHPVLEGGELQPLDFREVPEPGSLKGSRGEAGPGSALPEPHTYRLAEVTCAGVHALLPLAVAAAPTSVDGHTWRFKEGVCCCSKLLPHIYTHLPWHALSHYQDLSGHREGRKLHRCQSGKTHSSWKSLTMDCRVISVMLPYNQNRFYRTNIVDSTRQLEQILQYFTCPCVLSHVRLVVNPWTQPPGSSVHGFFSQARILEWVAISSSRDPPNSGIEPLSLGSCTGRWILYH